MAHLHGFPIQLYRAFEQQSDALLREYTLLAYADATQPYSADDVRRAGDAGATIAEAVARSGPGAERRSVEVAVGGDLVAGLELLQGVLDHSCDLARSGRLLAYPSLPEIVALRTWVAREVAAQAAGAAPTAWPATLAAHDGGIHRAGLAEWPEIDSLPADLAWIAGDDENRILAVSGPALTLLGWTEDELVGQRILTVIPPSLREAHVAGFTLNVVSGRQGLLGQPLSVPALTRDGREVPVILTLTRHSAARGRLVYLARLQPVPAS
jgi:PAS domain S-box-containing protein